MKNVQIIDGADNATYSIFQATEDEFRAIFPQPGQDLEIVEDYVDRAGEAAARQCLSGIWQRPIYKHDVQGIHGTMYYDYRKKSANLPQSKREIDLGDGQLNDAEKALYGRLRNSYDDPGLGRSATPSFGERGEE